MKNNKDKNIIISITFIFFLFASVHTYYSYLKVQDEQKNFAFTESKILNDFMFIHREYYQKLFINKAIELNEKTLAALPAYSSYSISEKFSLNNQYNIKVQTVSDRARNPKNQADENELDVIEYFKNNPDKKEYFKYLDNAKDQYYQYGYALRIETSCLKCHSSKEKAPKFIAKRYKEAYDYKIGDVRGIISVKIPKEHTYDYVHERFMDNTIYNLLTLALILIVTILILLKREKDIKALESATLEANSANRAKTEFLANMSHEIRTPLNAILGFVDILKEEETDNKKLKYLNTIDSSSQSLLGVINDILDLSKIESGKLEIDKINFNPTTEFESIAALFCAKSEEKQLCFNTYIDKNIPDILCSDPLRIKQILSNLLSNAIKFTKSGNVSLSIKYIKNTNKIRFSVKDSGIGISDEYKKSLFNPFTQEQSSTTREYGGTGLGLTISSQLVKLLGGELKVESKLGKGSEFFFELAIENMCQNDTSLKYFTDKQIPIKSENIVLKHTTFNGKKILLVEDNKANQMFMKVILKKLELNFDIANDGLEAIDMFKSNSYNAILMDENMPNLNGIEATKEILKIEKEEVLMHTPIIALTANALKGDRERFLDAGMDEYITKPVNKKVLAKILEKFLDVK